MKFLVYVVWVRELENQVRTSLSSPIPYTKLYKALLSAMPSVRDQPRLGR